MLLTQKQLELMRVITLANEDGSPADLDQILERIKYETSKASVQFSIRALIKNELIEKVGAEKRRGRKRTLISPTVLGRHYSAPAIRSSIVELTEDDDLL